MHLGEVGPWLEVLTSEDWTRCFETACGQGVAAALAWSSC